MNDNDTDIVLPPKRVTGDTLEARMTSNAYNNILPARYLHGDANGDLTETQEDLFPRVAKNVALAEVVHGPHAPDGGVQVKPKQVKDHLHSAPADKHTELTPIEQLFGEGVTVDDDVTIALTEENVSKFAYDNVVPFLPEDEHKKHVVGTKNQFLDLMEHLSFVPNSPTLMNAGLELQQLSACFVDSPGDDLSDIHQTVKEAAEVFQSGGGMGYAFWKLRPYGDPVGQTGGIASGPISFMRTFDAMCETIAQGGKRRGAQMGVMRVSHPDVIEFIHAKNKDVSLAHCLRLNDPDDYTYTTFGEALEEARDLIDEDGRVPKHLRNAVEGHLSNFNISVGVTDDFMDALYAGEEFVFENPQTEEPHIATEETKEMYSRYGLGEYVTPGEVLSLPADLIWDRIVDGAHQNGEPGVIYLERVNKQHSFDTKRYPDHRMLATNPCGEQPLEEYEACNLGHINLSTLVADGDDVERDFRVFAENHDGTLEEQVDDFLAQALDMGEFNHRIDVGTNFLENVVTMSDFPVPEIEKTVREMRKIGLGIMGLAQLYIQLGIRYGSEEGNEVARQVMKHINHRSKQASHDLAQVRGSFAEWDESKYAEPTEYREWFEHHTGESADDWADGYPIRNHNTTTIAPTGTTSMIGNTSGGCEPIFSVAYFKNVSDDVQGDEMLVEFDDYFLRFLEANDIDVEAVKQEAVEQMNNNEFDGLAGLSLVPDALAELFVVTADLSGIEHAAVQTACQEGVDSAISKTCNFPNSASKADMDEVYRYIYDNGGKGVTVYRDGTRSKQVLTTRADNAEFAENADDEQVIEALEARMDDATFREQVEGVMGEYGLDADVDAEELAEQFDVDLAPTYAEKRSRPAALVGVNQRIETGYGKLYVAINVDENGQPFEVFANIGSSGGFVNSFTEALAKTTSTALRSGVSPYDMADELKGIRSPRPAWDAGEQVHSIPDAIGLALRRFLDGDVETPSQGALVPSPESPAAEADATEDATQALIDAGESPECPECSSMQLYMSEGCKTCQSCGWSECS